MIKGGCRLLVDSIKSGLASLEEGRGCLDGARCAPPPAPPSNALAGQAADDGVEDEGDAVDDGHDDVADGADDGHEA